MCIQDLVKKRDLFCPLFFMVCVNDKPILRYEILVTSKSRSKKIIDEMCAFIVCTLTFVNRNLF